MLKTRLKSIVWQKNLPLKTPLATRLKLFTGGFKGDAQVIYALDRHDHRVYLSDTALRRTYGINGSMCSAILKDKLLAHAILRPYLNVSNTLAVIERGQIFPIYKGAEVKDVATLLESCRLSHGAILKPSNSKQGKGVISLKVKDGEVYLNEKRVAQADVHRLVGGLDNYLIEAFVEQAAYAAAIYPHISNTLRVVTMQDPDRNHEPFVAFAIHKFGTKESIPADNWARGSLCAPIDLESGELGRGIKHPSRTGGKLIWYEKHPETASQIAGVRVPEWSLVKEQLLKAVEALKFLRYIGWDVVVSPTGPRVIEGNTRTSIDFLQVHKPLLEDERIRRFYAYYGVI